MKATAAARSWPTMTLTRLLAVVSILVGANHVTSLVSPSVGQRRYTWTSKPAIPGTLRITSTATCSPLWASVSTSPTKDPSSDGSQNKNSTEATTVRSRLRKLTGFSLTAFRASARAFVAAIYVATLTATGAWIRQLTKWVLSIFPPAVRYFFQPLLILYYAPLFILKNLTGPTRKRAVQSHEKVMEGWRSAVQKADDTVSYWPIHIAQDGKTFESDGTVKLEEGVFESVDVAMDVTMEEDTAALENKSSSDRSTKSSKPTD